MISRAIVKQCASCPWRVDCVPERDIPNGYSVELHRGLRRTIQSGLESMTRSECHVMACHYSKTGAETPCAGWLHNQLGPGNNLGVRFAVMRGTMPVPEVDGTQHETFDDTLPKTTRAERGIVVTATKRKRTTEARAKLAKKRVKSPDDALVDASDDDVLAKALYQGYRDGMQDSGCTVEEIWFDLNEMMKDAWRKVAQVARREVLK